MFKAHHLTSNPSRKYYKQYFDKSYVSSLTNSLLKQSRDIMPLGSAHLESDELINVESSLKFHFRGKLSILSPRSTDFKKNPPNCHDPFRNCSRFWQQPKMNAA
ncbi:hypothetical protein EGR_07970 [Echinococcus granulosus]|uniref:Uncharacterized protein n=1 Tax=Echinococcus granulosus TaxID=6210 RepID=W6U7E6_ECHGR|nr:hypothetical protein EGR_07970 [Echinococcus granulosus]EUB57153.1 hypothetical protein EGR_07970 [Echinococcus granulosus]